MTSGTEPATLWSAAERHSHGITTARCAGKRLFIKVYQVELTSDPQSDSFLFKGALKHFLNIVRKQCRPVIETAVNI